MQRYGLRIIVVGGALLGIALAAEPPPLSPAEMVQVGYRYYVRYCSTCHGAEGRGDGPAAAALQRPPADLTRIAQRRGGHFPVVEITAVIDGRTEVPAHGRRDMPIWGERFGPIVGHDAFGEVVIHSHLQVLIAYLQAIQQ